MKIIVKVKTQAKENSVQRVNQPTLGINPSEETLPLYKVSAKEAPVNGRANDAIIKILADYFDTSVSCVSLISGQTSKQKIFEILK